MADEHTKKPYVEWMNSDEAKDKLRKLIETSGFPLELRAKRILVNKGYTASHSFYESVDENGTKKLREIDIIARKMYDKLEYHNCEIDFNLTIIGECKYSSTNDFFTIKAEHDLPPSFPVLFNAKEFFGHVPQRNFKLPVMQNVIEVDTKNHKVHPAELVIYEGCNQILGAFAYFLERYERENFLDRYKNIRSNETIRDKFDEYVKEKSPETSSDSYGLLTYDRQVLTDFLTSKVPIDQFLQIVGHFEVEIGIPILILAEDNGIIQLMMKEGKVEDFQDIGYATYLFSPNVSSQYLQRLVGSSWYFPIIITNVNRLEDCLNAIEKGLSSMIEEGKKTLGVHPYYIFYEAYDFLGRWARSGV